MADITLEGWVPLSQAAPLRYLRMRAVEKNSAKRAKRFPLPLPATPPTRPARVIPFAPERPRTAAHRRAVGKFRREDDSVIDGDSPTVCSVGAGRGEAAWFDMIRERTESPSRPRSAGATRPQAAPRTPVARARSAARPRSAGATRAAAGTPLSATRPYSERRFVPRGPEIHAKLPPARHTVQRPPRRPRTADASLRRRITRARPLPRKAETAHVPRTTAPMAAGAPSARYFEFSQDLLRADAQFRGRQATFKRYSATSIDELHPSHNARA